MLLTIGLAAWLGIGQPAPTPMPKPDALVKTACERAIVQVDNEMRRTLCCGPCLPYMRAGTICQSFDCGPGYPAVKEPFPAPVGGNP